jgi:hypothetical protein
MKSHAPDLVKKKTETWILYAGYARQIQFYIIFDLRFWDEK